MSEYWEDDQQFSEEYFESAKSEILKKLDNKYFLVGINDYSKFIYIIGKEKISYEKFYEDGLEYEELKKWHKVFSANGIISIFMPFGLIKRLFEGKNLYTLYTFKQLIGDKKEGVLIPFEVDLSEGKPDRQQHINENDTKQLGNMIDALNNGNLDFDSFLRLT